MRKKLLLFTTAVFVVAILASLTFAVGLEYTTTLLYFNIASQDEVTVTILNENPTYIIGGGAVSNATAQNIEFNTSLAYDPWVNATVTGGGTTQSDNSPIISIQNTGTTVAQINITVNETIDTATDCLELRYSNDTDNDGNLDSYPSVGDTTNLNTTNVTIVNNFAYGESPLRLWLFGNFSGCTPSDSKVLQLRVYANFTNS